MILVIIAVILSATCVANAQTPCVKWGNTFDVSLESSNVIRDCELPDKRKICCAAVDESIVTRGVGASYVPNENAGNLVPTSSKGKTSCTVQKKYVSSPQELRELAEADRIERIPGDKNAYMIEDRYHALMRYVTSDEYIRNSTIWLERVKHHMSSEGEAVAESPADREYLSRFEFTRTCTSVSGTGEASVTSWTEWIEPIGITARHPFGFGKCRQSPAYYNKGGAQNANGQVKPRVGRSDVDYVLLQSGASLHQQTHTASGKRIRTNSNSNNGKGNGGNKAQQPASKHFLFDAGTSTFDSSLFWFTCAYSQVSRDEIVASTQTCRYFVLVINFKLALLPIQFNSFHPIYYLTIGLFFAIIPAWSEFRPGIRVGDDAARTCGLLAPGAAPLEALLALPQRPCKQCHRFP